MNTQQIFTTRLTRFFVQISLFAGLLCQSDNGRAADQPNVLIILCDDLGYADVGVHSDLDLPTPNLNQLATESIRFADFYVAESVCTASRVGLLTGMYPERVGLSGAIGPASRIGIHAQEQLLPEHLLERGYITAAFGKWHLGDQLPFLPLQHGFKTFFGIPYSNDMWPEHPSHGDKFPPLPLLVNNQVIDNEMSMHDQNLLTQKLTDEVVQFVNSAGGRPFFGYVAFPMPHVPLAVSDKFRGRNDGNLYWDVLEELDFSIGRILTSLEENGLVENTIVIFTSDNGPWLSYGNHSGSAAPFRDGKHTLFDGGFRVPCFFRYPKRFPEGRVVEPLVTNLDLLPTLADMIGFEEKLSTDIDGHSVVAQMKGEDLSSPWNEFHFQKVKRRAVRAGEWKLFLPSETHSVIVPGKDGMPGETKNLPIPLSLYRISEDLSESENVVDSHPAVAKRLRSLSSKFDAELARASREPGRVKNPVLLNEEFVQCYEDAVVFDASEFEVRHLEKVKGAWSIGDAVFSGSEVPEENHGASLHVEAPHESATVEYLLRFRSAKRHTIGVLNDRRDGVDYHLYRVDFFRDRIQLVKDQKKSGGRDADSQILDSKLVDFPEDKWISIRISNFGDQIRIDADEHTLSGSHAALASKKKGFNLYISNGLAECKDLRVIHLPETPNQTAGR